MGLLFSLTAMKLTLNNIEKAVASATKKLGLCVSLVVTFDCGNAYVNVKDNLNAITAVIFDDNGEFSGICTTQYKYEVMDDDGEPTGEFIDVDNEVYTGTSLTAAINKLRLVA
jgi:hypothetical protein